MTTHDYRLAASPGRARLTTALALQLAGQALLKAARRLMHLERAPAGEPVLEFYAQSGAPEGALYVDGQLVGLLPGVSRL